MCDNIYIVAKTSFYPLFKIQKSYPKCQLQSDASCASLKIARHNLCLTALSCDWLTQNMDRSENSRSVFLSAVPACLPTVKCLYLLEILLQSLLWD